MACARCRDLGILRIQNLEQAMDTLAYCPCGAKTTPINWRLPQLSKKMERAFEVSYCPLSWFLPDNGRGSVPRGWLTPSVDAKILEWTRRVQDAEKFWQEWGTVFDDKVTHWSEGG